MKNITLSMSESLIAQSRAYAQKHGTTLNQLVRELLAREVRQDEKLAIDHLFETADRLKLRFGGEFLTREEANERP